MARPRTGNREQRGAIYRRRLACEERRINFLGVRGHHCTPRQHGRIVGIFKSYPRFDGTAPIGRVELRTLELQKLSGQLLRVQDTERRRLSRTLHDELGQELAALKMTLEVQDSGQGEMKLSSAVEMTERALAKVRNLSYLLHPPLLDESGLLPALHWYFGGLQKRSQLQIDFNFRPIVFPRLSRDIETAIFRVIQEALTNTYRHSGSESVRIDIDQEADRVNVRVRDFGKGIGPSASAAGVGINSMAERIRQLKGELKVSRADPGTLVEATLPFELGLPGLGL